MQSSGDHLSHEEEIFSFVSNESFVIHWVLFTIWNDCVVSEADLLQHCVQDTRIRKSPMFKCTYSCASVASYPIGHWDDLADFPATMPPGADSTNVPTQEFWTSDRKQAQLSQGRYKSASPLTQSLPHSPENGSWDLWFCFFQTNHLRHHSSSVLHFQSLP